jgi:hypothetical protein
VWRCLWKLPAEGIRLSAASLGCAFARFSTQHCTCSDAAEFFELWHTERRSTVVNNRMTFDETYKTARQCEYCRVTYGTAAVTGARVPLRHISAFATSSRRTPLSRARSSFKCAARKNNCSTLQKQYCASLLLLLHCGHKHHILWFWRRAPSKG